MEFIRENILKIVFFVLFLIILIVVFSFFFGGGKNVKINSYLDMENYVLTAGKNYYSKNKDLLPKTEKETKKINLDTLVNEKYIKELSAFEDENVKCSGYVESTLNGKNYSYVPYLKCGKYYETQTLANYIINNENIVSSLAGLYKVGDKYVFKGENPNNVVLLGDKYYRIMDIDGDKIRLVSIKNLSSLVWDNRYNVDADGYYGINDYSKSRLKELLEDIYKYISEDYNMFSSLEREKMVSQEVCIGKRAYSNSVIDDSNECKNKISDQMVSLITVSDYARASSDPNCKNIYSKSCVNYNYMSRINSSFRTVTATSDNTYDVFMVSDGVAELVKSSNSFSTNYVITLDKSSLYSSGDGSDYNPYVVR